MFQNSLYTEVRREKRSSIAMFFDLGRCSISLET